MTDICVYAIVPVRVNASVVTCVCSAGYSQGDSCVSIYVVPVAVAVAAVCP